MNSILRKTLIAAAVAGAASANAATISSVDNDTTTSGIQQVISAEGYALLDWIAVGNVSGTSTSEIQVAISPEISTYEDSDLLEFTFGGAVIDTSATSLSGITVTDGTNTIASGFGYITDADDNTIGVKLDVITGQSANLNAANVTLYLQNVVLTDVDTAVTVDYEGTRNGDAFDQAAETTVATVASQFSASNATDLDATIDVENERTIFVGTTDTTDSFYNSNDTADLDGQDTFVVALSNTSNLLTATVSDVTHSVTTTGNFDWTLDSDSAFDTTTVDTTATTGTATESLSDDNATLSIAVDGDFTGTNTTTVVFDVPGDVTLVESEFTLSTVADYYIGSTSTNDSATVASGVDIGDWGLSGATRFVEFYPTGTGITQFVYIANTSDVDAEVEMSVMDDSGTTYECGVLDTVALGNAVTKFGPEVFTTLDECGVVGNRLAISFVINAPDANIDLTAGYNSRGDRVLVD